MQAKKKGVKPDDFPLYLHPSGQWARRLKHPTTKKWKTYYFGKDRDEAIKRWKSEKDSLFAGATPKTRSDLPSLQELGNVFIAAKRDENATTGKPGLRHIELLEMTIRRLIDMMGDSVVTEWKPTDFARIKLELFKPVKRTKPTRGKVFGRRVSKRSPETVAGDVRRIKVFLNWCAAAEHIPAPRYGGMFSPETEMAHTKQSVRKVRKDISASDLWKVIQAARVPFKPIVLLAINSGLGNRDIAGMELSDLDGSDWIDLPRLKTGADRRFHVWPETQEAIRAYLAKRPNPKKGYEHVLFLTSHGHPWMRGEAQLDLIDSIGSGFTKLRKDCGIARGSFYDLRRTFATVASECLDIEAVRRLMGHKPQKDDLLGRTYNQHISDARLKAVTDHVRTWLLGGKP